MVGAKFDRSISLLYSAFYGIERGFALTRQAISWLIKPINGKERDMARTRRLTQSASLATPPFASTFESLGQSPAFLDFQERLRRVAPVDRPVLLIGERGAGKELAARRLHFLSKRWNQPFVTLHCAALSPTLIESELFGHEAGAFTGARERRIGRFEAANGGTLFLDEISLIPIETQEKILRVVEYGSFERVGGGEPIHADVRIIGATSADLPREADGGRFKQDLLDRLSFEVLFLPPLRERTGDILLLAAHFATRMAHELGRPGIPEFSPQVVEQLVRHAWPGNIRELKNVVERAVYRSETAVIEEVDFQPFAPPYPPVAGDQPTSDTGGERLTAPSTPLPGNRIEIQDGVSLPQAVRQLEIERLRRALERCRYNQRNAAAALGVTYHQFRGLYRKHALSLRERP